MSKPPPHGATTGKQEQKRAIARNRICRAVTECLVEHGYADTSINRVVERAGVSKGALQHHFPSKEDLFKAVVRESIVGRFEEWGALMEQFTGSTGEMLRICYQSWWERIGCTRASGITKLMLCEAGNFPEIVQFYQHEVIDPAHALIRRALERGMASGEFRTMDLDYAVQTVVAPLMFLTLTRHSPVACMPHGADFNPQAFIDHQIDHLLRGLCAAPPPSSHPFP